MSDKVKKNHAEWFYRIAKTASRNERRCLRKSKFYRYLAQKWINAEPDGIWRYVMVMCDCWANCAEIFGDMADTSLRKYNELTAPEMPVEEIDEEVKEN